MNIKSLNEFKNDCEYGFCNRRTFISKTCYKSSKQERCYKQYCEKQLKNQEEFEKRISEFEIDKDPKYTEFRKKVWLEDCGFYDGEFLRNDWKRYCKIWNILNEEQREIFERRYEKDMWFRQYLDVCHIKEKSKFKELKYDTNNAIVVSRFFHNLLDQFRHPITQQRITKEEREAWFRIAKSTPLIIGD